MIEAYKNVILDFNNRFPDFIKEYKETKKTGTVVSEKFARITRNWMLNLRNILSYDPIFSDTPNLIEGEEEQTLYDKFKSHVYSSVEIYKEVLESYEGGMKKKLEETFDIENYEKSFIDN